MGIKCCFNCTERTLRCHSTCERYLAERREFDKVKEAERKYNELASIKHIVGAPGIPYGKTKTPRKYYNAWR